MNNPNRNSYGAPRLVYRIDSRPPEIVFRDGFVAWGSNTDFFRHILGVIQNPSLPYHLRSVYVSTTDSPDSALRFFAARFSSRHHFNQPDNPHIMYLYEIRADESFYSTMATGNRCLEIINQNRHSLSNDAATLAWAGLRALFYDFAYQREWIHVGNISPRNIRSVHRVQAVPVDPRYAKYNRRTHNYPTYATVRLEREEYINPNYVDGFTYANHLPLEITVTHNEVGRTDFTTKSYTTAGAHFNLGPHPTPPSSGAIGGVSLRAFSNTTTAIVGTDPSGPDISMGFACPTAGLSSVVATLPSYSRSKRDADNNEEDYDYYDEYGVPIQISPLVENYKYSFLAIEEIEEELKLIYVKQKPDIIKQKVLFRTGGNSYFALKAQKDNDRFNAIGVEESNLDSATDIFYDAHLRLTTELDGVHYPVSLTINYSRELSEKTYGVSFETSSINNDDQKWVFNLYDYQKNETQLWFTIDSVENKNMCLYLDVHSKELVLREKFNNNLRYKILYVVVSKDKTEHTILRMQKPLNNLIDMGLEWVNPNNNNIYRLNTGNRKFYTDIKNVKYKFFYDLETFEILDLEDKTKSFALYNNSFENEYYTVRWVDVYPNQKRPFDKYRWYLKTLYSDEYKDLTRKQIVSFVGNNLLRVSCEDNDTFAWIFLENQYNKMKSDTTFRLKKKNLF